MATQQQFKAAITRIDEATNNIAADLRALKEVILNAGLPADVEDTVLAQLEEAAARLEAVAAETEEATTTVEPATTTMEEATTTIDPAQQNF